MAVLALAGTWIREPGPVLVLLVAIILGAAVLAATHHSISARTPICSAALSGDGHRDR